MTDPYDWRDHTTLCSALRARGDGMSKAAANEIERLRTEMEKWHRRCSACNGRGYRHGQQECANCFGTGWIELVTLPDN